MASVDYFLKLDGIDGESQDSKLKAHIELLAWSWGEVQQGISSFGSGSGAGKVSMQDFQLTKLMDKASPKLFLACANGEHIKTALLICRKAGKDQQEFFRVKMEEVLVSSFQTGGSGGGGDISPTEQISLNFTKITMDYKPQKADGTLEAAITAGWSVKENKKV